MAKILTDNELIEIIIRAKTLITEAPAYAHFLEDLGELICNHFGGTKGCVSTPDGDLGWTVGIHINDCVPDDGGVYKDYDKDVEWKDGIESEN